MWREERRRRREEREGRGAYSMVTPSLDAPAAIWESQSSSTAGS